MKDIIPKQLLRDIKLQGEAARYGFGGNVRIDLIDFFSGQFAGRIEGHNLVVSGGLSAFARALAGYDTLSQITHIAYGSDATATVPGQVALGAEVAGGRLPISRLVAVGPTATAQHYLASGQLNGLTLREIGLYAGTILVARFTFNEPTLQPKTSARAVVVTWSVTGSAV